MLIILIAKEASVLFVIVRLSAVFSVPVKLAALVIVWPLISPDVRVVIFPAVVNRFVELAVIAKKFVVVALVEMMSAKPRRVVKFGSVVVAERRLSKRGFVQ